MTSYRFETVVLQTDRSNANGRVYPREIVEKALEAAADLYVPIVSETNDWGGSIIPLDKIIGEVIKAWVDRDGKWWVRGRFGDSMHPLKGMNQHRAIALIQAFKLIPIGHGSEDEFGNVVEGYRINGYLTSNESADEAATTMSVTLIE